MRNVASGFAPASENRARTGVRADRAIRRMLDEYLLYVCDPPRAQALTPTGERNA